ncbi:hypothetical protein [Bacillus sp. T33-2]|uniref:hypothetical protein n=1 Tax=Bacillus sp. T33-2 TaxID=2054168 RepID=UPI000C790A82|nr:hypothetical protein [Bacillus sp. T33-2]PLR97442.1 hypothetical protein CVD19_08100 [Bacillus sp. T33-2]
MRRKQLIITGVLSLVFTLFTPFIFDAYFEKKPDTLEQNVSFGAPFPFVQNKITLPANQAEYPVELSFQSPLSGTGFQLIPFLLSFTCIYLLMFSLIGILVYYFKRDGRPD